MFHPIFESYRTPCGFGRQEVLLSTVNDSVECRHAQLSPFRTDPPRNGVSPFLLGENGFFFFFVGKQFSALDFLVTIFSGFLTILLLFSSVGYSSFSIFGFLFRSFIWDSAQLFSVSVTPSRETISSFSWISFIFFLPPLNIEPYTSTLIRTRAGWLDSPFRCLPSLHSVVVVYFLEEMVQYHSPFPIPQEYF